MGDAQPDKAPERAPREARPQGAGTSGRSLEDLIEQNLRASESEMRASPAFGKPLPDDGYFDAPPELRLAFKVLKDAGAVPPEVALMQELQAMRDRLAMLGQDSADARELRHRIADMELLIAMRVERLAKTLSL